MWLWALGCYHKKSSSPRYDHSPRASLPWPHHPRHMLHIILNVPFSIHSFSSRYQHHGPETLTFSLDPHCRQDPLYSLMSRCDTGVVYQCIIDVSSPSDASRSPSLSRLTGCRVLRVALLPGSPPRSTQLQFLREGLRIKKSYNKRSHMTCWNTIFNATTPNNRYIGHPCSF